MPDVRRVTIKDVARDAGVSVSTVSNWLSGRTYGVSPATRLRVEASANRLGYRPSALAARAARHVDAGHRPDRAVRSRTPRSHPSCAAPRIKPVRSGTACS